MSLLPFSGHHHVEDNFLKDQSHGSHCLVGVFSFVGRWQDRGLEQSVSPRATEDNEVFSGVLIVSRSLFRVVLRYRSLPGNV